MTLTACTDKKADLLSYIDKMDFTRTLDYYDNKINGSSKEDEILEEIGREMDINYRKIIEAYNNGEIEIIAIQ